jgi:hypothetical protein
MDFSGLNAWLHNILNSVLPPILQVLAIFIGVVAGLNSLVRRWRSKFKLRHRSASISLDEKATGLAKSGDDSEASWEITDGDDDAPTPAEALEIEAGRLVYQIPERMWRGVPEKVEVRLGREEAKDMMLGFAGRGDITSDSTPIVETMSVTLASEPGVFDIQTRSERDQLVKPNLVKGTPLEQHDFGKWSWVVTPLKRGRHALYVKISAALKDSRGLPTTSALPDKIVAVTVRVQLMRSAIGGVSRTAITLFWTVITALVGAVTKDYWWPFLRDFFGLD